MFREYSSGLAQIAHPIEIVRRFRALFTADIPHATMNDSDLRPGTKGEERIIEFTWRIAVIVALVSQVLTAALLTHWGKHNVPALMVRLGIFQARQVASILDLVHPPGADTAQSLDCRVAWRSSSVVTLSCPSSLWRYGGNDGTSQ
jgi:hypothetical protein